MDGDKIGTADRRQLPVVFCPAPECPQCRGKRFDIRRSFCVEESTTRYVTCTTCGKRFKIIIE